MTNHKDFNNNSLSSGFYKGQSLFDKHEVLFVNKENDIYEVISIGALVIRRKGKISERNINYFTKYAPYNPSSLIEYHQNKLKVLTSRLEQITNQTS